MKLPFLGLLLCTFSLFPNTTTFSPEQLKVEDLNAKRHDLILRVGIARENNIDYFGYLFKWNNEDHFFTMKHPAFLPAMRRQWQRALEMVSKQKGRNKKKRLQDAADYTFSAIYKNYLRPCCWKKLGFIVERAHIDAKAMQKCMESSNIEEFSRYIVKKKKKAGEMVPVGIKKRSSSLESRAARALTILAHAAGHENCPVEDKISLSEGIKELPIRKREQHQALPPYGIFSE